MLNISIFFILYYYITWDMSRSTKMSRENRVLLIVVRSKIRRRHPKLKIVFKSIKLPIYMSLGFREPVLVKAGDVGQNQNSQQARTEYRRLAVLGVAPTWVLIKSYPKFPRARSRTRGLRADRARAYREREPGIRRPRHVCASDMKLLARTSLSAHVPYQTVPPASCTFTQLRWRS